MFRTDHQELLIAVYAAVLTYHAENIKIVVLKNTLSHVLIKMSSVEC